MIVADTNLLVYLYIRGQRTMQAEAVLIRDPVWMAPLLWRSEFRSTLVGLVRAREIDLDDALRISHDAERRMGGAEFSVASQQVLQLSIRSRCSAYDCEFIALALDLRVPFVTADRQCSPPSRRPRYHRPSSSDEVGLSWNQRDGLGADDAIRRRRHAATTSASAGPSGWAPGSSGPA